MCNLWVSYYTCIYNMKYFNNPEQQIELTQYLEPGETLLWWGMPKQGVIFSKMDFFLIPFSIIWGGFAIAWETIAIIAGAPWFFILFGIPFVLVGIYLMIGRFFYDALRRKNTIYGLTKKRIIFLSGVKEKKAEYINISELKSVRLFDKPDGSGTIFLSDVDPFSQQFKQSNIRMRSSANKIPSLEFIPDAVDVYNKITRLQKAENH